MKGINLNYQTNKGPEAEKLPGFYFVSDLGGTDKSIIPIGVSVFLAEYMIRIRTLRHQYAEIFESLPAGWANRVVAGGLQMREHEVNH